MWQHPINNIIHLHMFIIARLSREIWVMELFLLKIIVKKKKGIGKEGGREREGEGKKGVFNNCFFDPFLYKTLTPFFFLGF